MYGGAVSISRADSLRKGVHPERFLRQAIERYDAEIAYNDSTIEQLAGKLKDLGILDNTLVIVLSDHGEEFWDHGWTGHGHSLYQELTRVPWLMWPEAAAFAKADRRAGATDGSGPYRA